MANFVGQHGAKGDRAGSTSVEAPLEVCRVDLDVGLTEGIRRPVERGVLLRDGGTTGVVAVGFGLRRTPGSGLKGHDVHAVDLSPAPFAEAYVGPLCAQLVITPLADSGHYPMQEMPPLTVALVERFLGG